MDDKKLNLAKYRVTNTMRERQLPQLPGADTAGFQKLLTSTQGLVPHSITDYVIRGTAISHTRQAAGRAASPGQATAGVWPERPQQKLASESRGHGNLGVPGCSPASGGRCAGGVRSASSAKNFSQSG